MTTLHEAARALLDELDGHEYPTHKVIDSARIRDASNALRAALAADSERVSVPREPKPGLLCGDVAVSTDPRYAGFVFVRHIDGVNWTTCAKMTPETWAMLAAAEKEKS